jgi:hypothetical protein
MQVRSLRVKHCRPYESNAVEHKSVEEVQQPALCATDVDRLRLGRGLLLEAFVGGLAAEAPVGAMVVVAVLPLAQRVVETAALSMMITSTWNGRRWMT